MRHNLSELKGLTLKARDGDIGEAEDFYFDDENWAIRYLVVNTGSWLAGRRALISPISLRRADEPNQRLEVDLNKKQIEDSPGVETDQPVSRQEEASYFDYYGYPYYWTGPYLWGPAPYPAPLAVPEQVQSEVEAVRKKKESADPHMRSANEVTGYYIEASDGEIGHVEDFIADDDDWAIRYMVVDTRNWWPGKKVLISPHWIERTSWHESQVHVNLPRKSIQQAPEYRLREPLTRDYEASLHQHYGRAPYRSE